MKHFFLIATASVALLLPQSSAWAQPGPAVVVSIGNAQRLVSDVSYLTTAAGAPEMAPVIQIMGGAVLGAVDPDKPSGVLVYMDGPVPQPLGFVPIRNFAGLLQLVESQVGQAQDVGNGVKKLTLDQPVFFKEHQGYVFIAQSSESLGALPANPTAALAGLEKSYDLAVRVNVQNIPTEMRSFAMKQIEQAFQQARRGGDEELARQVSQNTLDQLKMVMSDTEHVTLGWGVDSQRKRTFVEVAFAARPNSELSDNLAGKLVVQSQHAGFSQLPGAAAVANFSSKVTSRDIQQLTTMIDLMKKRLAAEMDRGNNPDRAAEKEAVRSIVDLIGKLVVDTAKSGRFDGGAVLMMGADRDLQVALGGHVVDQKTVEDLVRQLNALAQKAAPNTPTVQFNASRYRDIAFHTMQIPVPADDEARRLLGKELNVSLGVGPESAYLAFGGDATGLIKRIVDASAQATPLKAPVWMQVSLTPILQFASTVEKAPQLSAVIAALDKAPGLDHVTVYARPENNGVTYRFDVEEGILQAVGQAVRSKSGN